MVAMFVPNVAAITVALWPLRCIILAWAMAESLTVSGWSVAGAFSVVAVCAGAALAVGRDCIALDGLALEIAMDAM